MTGINRIPRLAPRRLLVAAVLGILGALAIAGPASAHAALLRTSPAQNSVVATAPSDVALTFSEPVTPVPDKVRLVGPDGKRAEAGPVRVNGSDVLIPMDPKAPRGTYLVNFRVVSADGHPVAGAFTFSVGARSPGGPPTDSGATTSSGVPTIALAIVRYIGYGGLVLLVGAALVLGVLWPRRLDSSGPAKAAWIGAGVVAVATVAELVLEVPYVSGSGLFSAGGAAWQEVLGSRFGTAHLVRLGVLGVSLILLRPLVRGKSWGSDRVLLAVLGVVGFATWSVSGHPGATPVPMITVIADMIHIGAMSVWLGGLLMLFLFLLPQGNGVELSAIVPIWSRWATYAVGTLVLTGVAQGLVQVGTFSALVNTTYGRLIIVKVALVCVTLGVASLSRRLVAPIATETPGAALKMRMIVLYEVAILAMVLGTTSVLVQTTPARTASVQTVAPTLQQATLTSPLYVLQFDISPATDGNNELHLYASAPDGGLIKIEEWKGKASLPSQGIEGIDINLLGLYDDHASGQVTLPAPGKWTFTFTLRTTDIDQATVTTEVDIRAS
jgi:copper transport protein